MSEARTVDHLEHSQFDFPPGCRGLKRQALTAIVVREIDAEDEEHASKLADSAEAYATYMVMMSIVSVNGQRVAQPFLDFRKWPKAAREVCLTYYLAMNPNAFGERKADFLAKAVVVDPKTLTAMKPTMEAIPKAIPA